MTSLSLDVVTWDRVMLLITICALSAGAGTEVVRQLLIGWRNVKKSPKPWWQLGALRGLAVILGASSGYLLGSNPLGAIIGVGAGGLTTSVVAFLKAKLKANVSS